MQPARQQPVSLGALLDLVHHVRHSHPLDAGAFYLCAPRTTAEHLRGASDYKDLARYLKEAASLLPAAEWRPFLAEVHEQHRRKRKLLEMLDTIAPS